MIVRSLILLLILALLSACRSTPPPRTASQRKTTALGSPHPYPVAAPRKAGQRLVTPVARVPMN